MSCQGYRNIYFSSGAPKATGFLLFLTSKQLFEGTCREDENAVPRFQSLFLELGELRGTASFFLVPMPLPVYETLWNSSSQIFYQA